MCIIHHQISCDFAAKLSIGIFIVNDILSKYNDSHGVQDLPSSSIPYKTTIRLDRIIRWKAFYDPHTNSAAIPRDLQC